jgi:hypothetical protein
MGGCEFESRRGHVRQGMQVQVLPRSPIYTKGENMNKQITRPSFGFPSIETTGRIDDHDKMSGIEAARYRCVARMRQLESEFEAKASEIRAEFVQECSSILAETAE